MIQTVVFVDQAALLERLEDLRQCWIEVTGGEMERVTLDLGMLFDDIRSMIAGEETCD